MATRAARPVEYPSSDGKPMAESDLHRRLLFAVVPRLDDYFRDRDDVYVSGNLLVYYVEGDPRRVLAPDCFVAFGVPKGNRETFRTWDEGTFPAVVIEFTSKTTAREDQRTKLGVYRDIWRVKEYFLFDPREDYLTPSLQGYRRRGSELRPIRAANGVLTSKTLGVTLERDGEDLLLRDAVTGRVLLTADERATLEERGRTDLERKRTEREKRRAEDEKRRAETEAEGRRQAEAELARLRAELDALRKGP
jgi:Uma2 family endonuclease